MTSRLSCWPKGIACTLLGGIHRPPGSPRQRRRQFVNPFPEVVVSNTHGNAQISELRRVHDDRQRRLYYDIHLDNSADHAATSARRAYEMIRTLLRSGSLGPSEAISESALTQTLGASRNAVRKALQQLADEGVVIRRPKNGTRLSHEFVRVEGGQVVPHGMTLGAGDGRLVIEQTRNEPVRLTPILKAKLDTEDTWGVLSESRFAVDDEPLSLRVGYITGNVTEIERRLKKFDRAKSPPYEEAFHQLYGVEFGSSHSTFEAIRCEARTARILGIEAGAPVLLSEMVVRDREGAPRELSYTYYRSDRVCISHATYAARGPGWLPA
ncbi:GntR family transcriptional regulator [Microbacterium aquimaris]|uniref:GntR family transcriptional regulator n=1 Tax=Microbacterium aquimaris TaxID=459816 RepID=A0ABU5N5B1_9MICO|nr:GntR family transcriptional regulator [Microbacterium aquimaris]MDZ8161269.1 GntR family transcriptional regulator [Microbacterium aquimaris]